MSMMKSQILKPLDFTETQNSRYLEKETFFFLQIKEFINYTSSATILNYTSRATILNYTSRDTIFNYTSRATLLQKNSFVTFKGSFLRVYFQVFVLL